MFRDDPTDTQPTILIGVDLWTEDSPSIWQAVVEKLKKYIGKLWHAASFEQLLTDKHY